MAGNFAKLAPTPEPTLRDVAIVFLDRWTHGAAEQFRWGNELVYADRYVVDQIRTALDLPAIQTDHPVSPMLTGRRS